MNQTDEITYPCIIEVSNIDFEELINCEDDPYDLADQYPSIVKKRVCIGKVQNNYICIQSKENQLEQIMLNLTTPVKNSSNYPTWVSSGSVSGLVLQFFRFGRKIERKMKFTEWLKS